VHQAIPAEISVQPSRSAERIACSSTFVSQDFCRNGRRACLAGTTCRLLLQSLSEQTAECYRLARHAKDKAEHAAQEATRRDYMALEQRWMKIGQSYELLQRVTA
jgi:hypothetical protein